MQASDFVLNTTEDRKRTARAFASALSEMAEWWQHNADNAEEVSTYLADDLERFPNRVFETMHAELKASSDADRLLKAIFGD